MLDAIDLGFTPAARRIAKPQMAAKGKTPKAMEYHANPSRSPSESLNDLASDASVTNRSSFLSEAALMSHEFESKDVTTNRSTNLFAAEVSETVK